MLGAGLIYTDAKRKTHTWHFVVVAWMRYSWYWTYILVDRPNGPYTALLNTVEESSRSPVETSPKQTVAAVPVPFFYLVLFWYCKLIYKKSLLED